MNKFIFSLILLLNFTHRLTDAQPQTLGVPDSTPMIMGDASTATVPSPASALEVLEIDGRGEFTEDEVNVNDTLSYVITVIWKNPKVPITVLAPESLSFAGLKKTKVYTSHKKIATLEAGKPVVKSKSEFIYNLKAEIQGSGKASSTQLPYYTALGQEKEYVTIAPQLINIGAAKIPLSQRWFVKILFWILGAGILIYGIVIFRKKMKEKSKENIPEDHSMEDKLKDLKSRIGVADSREFILEMESLARVFLRSAIKNSEASFNQALELYQSQNNGKNKEQWEKLKKDFELAKFGGGNKASHELMESFKTLNHCIH